MLIHIVVHKFILIINIFINYEIIEDSLICFNINYKIKISLQLFQFIFLEQYFNYYHKKMV